MKRNKKKRIEIIDKNEYLQIESGKRNERNERVIELAKCGKIKIVLSEK